mmetsp:Transcript_23113/g.39705  ORF Transcript_23113/g.39705 Transcript_23113/m.39705 type:complete len:274 (-) Transcript_23113:1137-1958(-)
MLERTPTYRLADGLSGGVELGVEATELLAHVCDTAAVRPAEYGEDLDGLVEGVSGELDGIEDDVLGMGLGGDEERDGRLVQHVALLQGRAREQPRCAVLELVGAAERGAEVVGDGRELHLVVAGGLEQVVVRVQHVTHQPKHGIGEVGGGGVVPASPQRLRLAQQRLRLLHCLRCSLAVQRHPTALAPPRRYVVVVLVEAAGRPWTAVPLPSSTAATTPPRVPTAGGGAGSEGGGGGGGRRMGEAVRRIGREVVVGAVGFGSSGRGGAVRAGS